MTLPEERTNAVNNTYQFLLSLLDPKKTPKVPKNVRRQASSLLRHYPASYYLELSQVKAPDIWGYPEKKKPK